MTRRNARWIAVLCLLGAGAAARTSEADGLRVQPVSYSVAIGKSGGVLLGHLWFGSGVRWASSSSASLFTLLGIEADFRAHDDHIEGDSEIGKLQRRGGGAAEAWLCLRVGIGTYRARAWAPSAALYLLGGNRLGGDDGGPRLRLGAGASVPAALPIAVIGIPTMVEAGVDLAGEHGGLRGFVRVGWNF